TDTALPVPLGTVAEMTAGFERAYRQQFSFLMPDKAILVEAVSVEVAGPAWGGTPRSGGTPDPDRPGTPRGADGARAASRQALSRVPSPDGSRGMPRGAGTAGKAESVLMYGGGRWADVPLARRRDLRAGERVDGPALIAEDFATTVVEAGWRA